MAEPGEKSNFQLTRELELLISAALVFALLQLPAILDAWWDRTALHVAGPTFGTVFTAYYVAKLVSYGLIVAIVTHFLLRGFWIAIMGLRSVYPTGVLREKLDFGSVFTRFYDTHLLTLDELEDRVDRVAASVLSFVFLILLIFLMVTIWSVIGWGLGFVIARITGNDKVVIPVIMGVFLVIIAMQSFAASVDRTSKKREVSAKTEAWALRMMKWTYYVSLNVFYAPVFFTFVSHTSKRRMNVLLIGFMYALIGVFALSILTSQGVIGFDSYVYYPAQARAQQLRAVHYDNIRADSTPPTEPTIQSEVIEGPYLRLFIPYQPMRDNRRLRALCPRVAPLRGEGVFRTTRDKLPEKRLAEIEACFDRLYALSLDGQPLPKPGFLFHREPRSGVTGRLAFVPVSALAPGRHVLTVRRTPIPGVKKKKEDAVADESFIHFWR